MICFALVMAAIGWFFFSQARVHWNQLVATRIDLHWPWLMLGLVLVIVHYLLATIAWRMALVGNRPDALSYVECIGLSNISQLTKYLPGKVWSYAIQMHLLETRNIPKTHVVSTNILMQLSLLTSAFGIGCGYLMYTKVLLPPATSRVLFALLATGYLCLVLGGAHAVNMIIRVMNRLFRKDIDYLATSTTYLLIIHLMNLAANFIYGVAAYVVALGIDAPLNSEMLGVVIAAALLSDAAGFMAVVAPGGIGVREGVMYAMLKPFMSIQFCFILPAVFRLVTSGSDLLLGGTALALIKRFTTQRTGTAVAAERRHT